MSTCISSCMCASLSDTGDKSKVKGTCSIRFFASLFSNSFDENSNLPSIYCTMLARLCNLCVQFCEITRKLLNYLMFGQTLSEVKMEMLKTHKFHFMMTFCNFVV